MLRGLDGYFDSRSQRECGQLAVFKLRTRSASVSHHFGGHSEGETPLPIPNRAVKPLSADGTWPERARESRSPPFNFAGRRFGGPLFLCSEPPVGLPAMNASTGHAALEEAGVATDTPQLQEALGIIRLLASDIGPRRPCSDAEKRAARELVAWLRERGVDANTEQFRGYATFAKPYALLFSAA